MRSNKRRYLRVTVLDGLFQSGTSSFVAQGQVGARGKQMLGNPCVPKLEEVRSVRYSVSSGDRTSEAD
jgi:hypothetical protein